MTSFVSMSTFQDSQCSSGCVGGCAGGCKRALVDPHAHARAVVPVRRVVLEDAQRARRPHRQRVAVLVERQPAPKVIIGAADQVAPVAVGLPVPEWPVRVGRAVFVMRPAVRPAVNDTRAVPVGARRADGERAPAAAQRERRAKAIDAHGHALPVIGLRVRLVVLHQCPPSGYECCLAYSASYR